MSRFFSVILLGAVLLSAVTAQAEQISPEIEALKARTVNEVVCVLNGECILDSARLKALYNEAAVTEVSNNTEAVIQDQMKAAIEAVTAQAL